MANRHPKRISRSARRYFRRNKQRRGTLGLILACIALMLAVVPWIGDTVNAWTKTYTGCRVLGVVDGDTIRLDCPISGQVTGRILAYDAPETRAGCLREFAMAQAATQYLRWILWSGQSISARLEGKDRFGRSLTVLIVDGEGVARQMVNAGLGRWYNGGRRAGWCEEGKVPNV